VRLYVDADITYKLAQALRARGFDAVAAYEVGMAEASDDAASTCIMAPSLLGRMPQQCYNPTANRPCLRVDVVPD
jgi:hypothetical protein